MDVWSNGTILFAHDLSLSGYLMVTPVAGNLPIGNWLLGDGTHTHSFRELSSSSHTHVSHMTLIGVHAMHGQMHPTIIVCL